MVAPTTKLYNERMKVARRLAPQIRESTEHCGHTNYETWSVSLILTNKQELEQKLDSIIRNASDVHEAEDAVKEWVECLLFGEDGGRYGNSDADLMANQLLRSAFENVNWIEVVANRLEP